MPQAHFAYTVEGDGHPDTIIFVHGWHDDGEMWRHQVDGLKARYRCVSVTLPNFGPEPDRRGA